MFCTVTVACVLNDRENLEDFLKRKAPKQDSTKIRISCQITFPHYLFCPEVPGLRAQVLRVRTLCKYVFYTYRYNYYCLSFVLLVSLKDAFYIAILRNPVGHFESVFYTYQIPTILGLQNSSHPLKEFLSQPSKYVLSYLQKESRLDINLNMVKNGKCLLKRVFYVVVLYS